MKAIALANRLIRDLKVKNLQELTADARQEIQDCVNAALQQMHALAPPHSKITQAAMVLTAPETVTLGLTQGSTTVTDHAFGLGDLFKTIRIAGDEVDNQVIGETELLHPWGGSTSTVTAVLYGDAVAIPEGYEEVISDPWVLETRRFLVQGNPADSGHITRLRSISSPERYWMEENAANCNPPSGPSVLRVDVLPDRMFRLEMRVSLAPARMSFLDFMDASKSVPMRDEHIEAYLLPFARAGMTESDLWRDKTAIASVNRKAERAEANYMALIPKTLATPANRTRTRRGF